MERDANMNPQTLGNSPLSVTPLGLGLAALGRPGYINLGHGADLNFEHTVAAMEARAHNVLDAAWDAGIRYFDAAEFQRKMAWLQTCAASQNSTVDAVALSAVIHQPFVDVVLSGAACVDHLQSNLRALRIRWDDSLGEMLAAMVEPAEKYWHIRSQLAWN